MIALAVWLLLAPMVTCIAGRCICFGTGDQGEELQP